MAREKSFFRHGMAKWGLFVLLLFGLWFGGWFIAANWADGKIGDVLTRLQDRGISVTCQNRKVRGFPFRMGVHCDEALIDDSVHQFSIQSGTVRSAAQIYAPRKNVVEVEGPLVYESIPVSLNANWELMRFYVEANRGGFDLLSTNFRKLDGLLNDAAFGAGKGEVHLRPTPVPENSTVESPDLDFATTLDNVIFADFGEASADIVADVTIGRGYGDFIVRRRAPRDWLADGSTIDIRTLALTTPEGGSIAIVGPLELHRDGSLSGKVKVGVENREELARWVAVVNPELGPMVTALGQGITLLGSEETISGRQMTALEVQIDRGAASVGLIKLGDIPPLVLD